VTVHDQQLERIAEILANADGWPWHPDDYVSPEPKWQPTNKDEYRETARAVLGVLEEEQRAREVFQYRAGLKHGEESAESRAAPSDPEAVVALRELFEEHKIEVREVEPRMGCRYKPFCSCGWSQTGRVGHASLARSEGNLHVEEAKEEAWVKARFVLSSSEPTEER